MYKEVIKQIKILENRKKKNQNLIKKYEQENVLVTDELKKLYAVRNQFDKANAEANTLLAKAPTVKEVVVEDCPQL